jgi:hypothetical protein
MSLEENGNLSNSHETPKEKAEKKEEKGNQYSKKKNK